MQKPLRDRQHEEIASDRMAGVAINAWNRIATPSRYPVEAVTWIGAQPSLRVVNMTGRPLENEVF